MHIRKSTPWILSACIQALLITGCQTTPTQESLGRLEVFDIPRQRQELPTNQQVSEEFEVFEPEIRQQRLVHVSCAIPDPTAYNGERQWNAMVLLPKRRAATESDNISIQPMPGRAANGKVFDLKAHLEALPDKDFHEYVVNGSKTVFRDLKCDFGSDGLPQHVKLLGAIPVFEFEYSKAERARHHQFTDDDFSQGRVGIGRCSLRDTFGVVYYQPSWLFRIPVGMTVGKGDVVEAELGETESGPGVGRVSQMTRVLGRREAFPSDGHSATFCK